MLNQGQGTYPQLAGSFYNSQQMMPHDNGRNARQVPTFFGGLQNMMSASTAMQNYQGMPMGQSILNTQSLASQQYGQSIGTVLGGVGTGMTIAGAAGTLGTMAKVGGALGTVAGSLAALPFAVATVGMGGIVHSYKKRMSAIDDMRNALEGSRMGYGLADPVTGNIGNQAALDLSRQMQSSARGSGFKNNDLKNIMGTASGLGMLNGMQSLSQVSKRVVELAKASKEIVMLGEGISMTDAMQLQKITQDMGISTNKFRSTNIGKNLVMAARASSMSMDQAAQVGGMGAMTYQQVGLGAASGMNAALYGNMASAGLMGVGAFNPRQLAALGGQQGVAQSLLGGQASTMARMGDSLVMGAVKLGADGSLGINRELLDGYVRGDISKEDLITRGKKLGKGMSKGARSRLMEELQFSMPRLREEMSDSLSSEEQMAISTRGILELKNKTGMSTRRAAHAYFQDANQAESYLGYAQNFEAVRGENNRQLAIADQEKMLRYAGMAKSSGVISKGARALVKGAGRIGSGLISPFTDLGEYLSEQTTIQQDNYNRGLRRIMGVSNTVKGASDLQDVSSYGLGIETTLGRRGPRRRGESYTAYFDRVGQHNIRAYERRTNQTSGYNVFMGGGIGQKIEELEEGDYNPIRHIGDYLGIDGGDAKRIYRAQAQATDASIEMGKLQRNRNHNLNDNVARTYYNNAVQRLRELGIKAADGKGSGDFGGVDSRDLYPDRLRDKAAGGSYKTLTQDQKDKVDAALGAAYRTMSNGTGKASQGYSAMKKRIAEAGALEFLGGDAADLDTLKLSDKRGTTLTSAGLSRAIQESGVKSRDLSRLINVYNTGQFKNTGGTNASIHTVLKRAGIDVSKVSVGKYRKLLTALEGATVSYKGGEDGKETITESLSDSYLGTSIDDLVGNATLENTKSGYIRDQLNKLDDRIAESVVGLEGRGLREDLVANMYSKDGGAANLARNLRERNYRERDAEEYVASRHADAKRAFREKAKKAGLDKIFFGGKGGRRAREWNYLMGIKGLDNAKKLKKEFRALNEEGLNLFNRGLQDSDRDKYLDDYYEEISKSGAMAGERESRAGGLLGYDTLSGMLNQIGEGKEKEAYKKLLNSEAGAGLMTSFTNLRRGYSGKDAQGKRDADRQMLREIIAAAERQKINVPGTGQSKQLPELLAEIALGIKDFRGAMSSIAKLKSGQDGTVTFQLVDKE